MLALRPLIKHAQAHIPIDKHMLNHAHTQTCTSEMPTRSRAPFPSPASAHTFSLLKPPWMPVACWPSASSSPCASSSMSSMLKMLLVPGSHSRLFHRRSAWKLHERNRLSVFLLSTGLWTSIHMRSCAEGNYCGSKYLKTQVDPRSAITQRPLTTHALQRMCERRGAEPCATR